MVEQFFGSVCMYRQRRVYVAYTARRGFLRLERRLNIASWNPVSILKGKGIDAYADFVEVFSLEMNESEADERDLFLCYRSAYFC